MCQGNVSPDLHNSTQVAVNTHLEHDRQVVDLPLVDKAG